MPETPNVWGTNTALSGKFWNDFWKQGGPLSKVMDRVWGQHSLSRLHDYFQIRLGGISDFARNFGNVPAMIPATAVNYVALLSTVPGYTAIIEER